MHCYPTQMKNSKGQTIRVFSASDYSTVGVHVKWMKGYGLAGVIWKKNPDVQVVLSVNTRWNAKETAKTEVMEKIARTGFTGYVGQGIHSDPQPAKEPHRSCRPMRCVIYVSEVEILPLRQWPSEGPA